MEGYQRRTLAGIYSKFTSMHLANWELHKVYEMFKAAGETTAADSLSSYMLAGSTIPPSQKSSTGCRVQIRALFGSL